jgi:hypothetical protein
MRAEFGQNELLHFVDRESLYSRGSPGQDVESLALLIPQVADYLSEITRSTDHDASTRIAALVLCASILQERSLPLLTAVSDGTDEAAAVANQLLSMLRREGFIYLD